MKTSRSVKKLTQGPSIHTYFDVIPESPNGKHITYFTFDGKPFNHGTVYIANRDGSNPVAVKNCPGNAHCGAHQGWLNNEQIYFSADGKIFLADLNGNITQEINGAIDTIDQKHRRGLIHSSGLRIYGGHPGKEACWRVDLDTGEMIELLNRETAKNLIKEEYDLSIVPDDALKFKHTKWAPDGKNWFVVFNNIKYWREHNDVPRIKVIIAADENGGNLRLIDSFNHHPNWLPDSSGIYAFAAEKTVMKWNADGSGKSSAATLSAEGHPCISPDNRLMSCDTHSGPVKDQTSILLYSLETGNEETLAEMEFPIVDWQVNHPPRRLCHPHPVWSHDGKRLYFNGIENNTPGLYVMEIT